MRWEEYQIRTLTRNGEAPGAKCPTSCRFCETWDFRLDLQTLAGTTCRTTAAWSEGLSRRGLLAGGVGGGCQRASSPQAFSSLQVFSPARCHRPRSSSEASPKSPPVPPSGPSADAKSRLPSRRKILNAFPKRLAHTLQAAQIVR